MSVACSGQQFDAALDLHRRGRLEDASIAYRRILAVDPTHFDALHMLGILCAQLGAIPQAEALLATAIAVRADPYAYLNRGLALFQLGRLDEALGCYDNALALKPDLVPALYHKGNVFLQRQRFAEAVASYEHVLAMQPTHREALNNLGTALAAMNRPEDAVAAYERILCMAPDDVAAHYNRALVLKDLARYEEALKSLDRALSIRSELAEVLGARGAVLNALDRFDEAISSCDRALALYPNDSAALINKGVALENLGRFDEALVCLDRASSLQGASAAVHYNKGNVLLELKRFDQALASFDRALQLSPGDPDALVNRGIALKGLRRHDDALASFERALSTNPAEVSALYNRGNTLQELDRFDEARACYLQSIALQPDNAQAHWNYALLCLLLGDYATGWREYEWRRKRKDPPRSFPRPLWLGDEPIAGKTVLLHAEQGFGDTIQFCRYARRVKDLGATVLLQAPGVLKLLLARLNGADIVLAEGEALPEFDFHCPLMSLPLAFASELGTIPAPPAYLSAPRDRVNRWHSLIGDLPQPRIGLAWSGSRAHKNDHNRSLPLAVWIAHLDPDQCFISLQKEVREQDRRVLARAANIRDFAPELRDFADTAALIEQLDLVVTVDTAVAHLAGALGKPVWILLPRNPDWRWMTGREDSPWYPSARLFRQTSHGDWHVVLDRIAGELRTVRPAGGPCAMPAVEAAR